MIERMKKKKNLQSSVIFPRNEIDLHPTEREITLADDTACCAVTVPETQHDSNRNNQHLSCSKGTHTHMHTQLLQTLLTGEGVIV